MPPSCIIISQAKLSLFQYSVLKTSTVIKHTNSTISDHPFKTSSFFRVGEVKNCVEFADVINGWSLLPMFKIEIKILHIMVLQCYVILRLMTKGRLSYHLCVKCFSKLSSDSEVYIKSAAVADFVYTSESKESCEKHLTQR